MRDSRIQLDSSELPENLRKKIEELLSNNKELVIDFAGLRSLSPSYADEAFGKLVDTFGPMIIYKLYFLNDYYSLCSRILYALQRRYNLLEISNKRDNK